MGLTQNLRYGRCFPVLRSVARTWSFRPQSASLVLTSNPSSCTSRLFRTSTLQFKGDEISMYDSLSERVQPLPTVPEKGLAWYTCGPTTYAPAHLGHARTYVWLDIIRRVMEAQPSAPRTNDLPLPLPPLFVMNITDVDDKILAAALEKQTSPIELARTYEAEFWKDLDALNCLRPHVVTRVTECVESDIVPYIARVVEKGMAYEAEDGVYFDVRAYNEQLGTLTRYGKLAPPAAAQDVEIVSKSATDHDTSPIETGERSNKVDPRDFVLWKKKKPDEVLSWPSPWGEGRPGWHIECSAMIEMVQHRFHKTHEFLVHAGGVDLKFPHHTNEIAQSEAYRQRGDWIPHWIHFGHLHIDGLKMSKSLKNFVSIQDFFAEYGEKSQTSRLESPSDDFRLWCLGRSGSYRGPATFSKERIYEARIIRQKILRFLMAGEDWLHRAGEATLKAWDEQDHTFFLNCQETRIAGLDALKKDMDGSKFVDEIMKTIELGNSYMAQERQRPSEPMKAVLSNLRSLLALVGFTEETTRAGIKNGQSSTNESNVVVGDERAVADALVQFRSAIRQAAILDPKEGNTSDSMKQILGLCDDIRDSILPKIGIQLLDSRAEEEKDSWRICLPRSDDSQHESSCTTSNQVATIDLRCIPLEDMFRVGQYEGSFSEYTAEGVPTHNVDGSEVSKRSLKKLMKKRDAHKVRLELS